MQTAKAIKQFYENKLFSSKDLTSKVFQLGKNDLHLWCTVRKKINNIDLPQFYKHLCEVERLRAERYHFADDQRHFIFRHGLLRILLSSYLNIEPSEVQINHNENGKPFLGNIQGKDTIQFNLSHSKGMVLVAFIRGRRIGVDIELMQPMKDMDAIVKDFFSATEQAAYKRLPMSQRMEGFYNCWTRKEAFLKALGDGLSGGLDTFDVSLKPGETPKLLSMDWASEEASRWSLNAFVPFSGYMAALAVEGHGLKPRHFHWKDGFTPKEVCKLS